MQSQSSLRVTGAHPVMSSLSPFRQKQIWDDDDDYHYFDDYDDNNDDDDYDDNDDDDDDDKANLPQTQ